MALACQISIIMPDLHLRQQRNNPLMTFIFYRMIYRRHNAVFFLTLFGAPGAQRIMGA